MVSQLSENPLSDELRLEKNPDPCTVVIFGASGDLARRKLVPALYSLYQQDRLSEGFAIIGSSRSGQSHQQFREAMKESVEEFSEEETVDSDSWSDFSESLFYCASDPSEDSTYDDLQACLEKVEREQKIPGNRLFYLSTPPSAYAPIIQKLGEKGLNKSSGEGWMRIVIEKPIGRDLESARELNRKVLGVFREDQVYRIDHYLGKETVQNILAFRFGNSLFEPLWHRHYIDHIQITAAESIGVEGRGGYYERSGALRDMIQNHLFQVFSMIAMEPPVSLEAHSVREEKTKVMRALQPIPPSRVSEFAVRGQYSSGSVNGSRVPGYRQEEGVDPCSKTETFAALKLYVDNWRWAEVPFYLRSGKRLPKRVSEVAIQFKRPPHLIFQESVDASSEVNSLILRIQPEEGITLRFRAKVPGQSIQIRPVNMDFRYGTTFGRKSPEAYQRLLLDAMIGDPTLFLRRDMVELSWAHLTPVLEAWQEGPSEIPLYEAGGWGPEQAHRFLEKDGRVWRSP